MRRDLVVYEPHVFEHVPRYANFDLLRIDSDGRTHWETYRERYQHYCCRQKSVVWSSIAKRKEDQEEGNKYWIQDGIVSGRTR